MIQAGIGTRDAIRILSWFKSNAPQTQVIVLANKVQPAAMLEISRKDFEGSIERKVDFVVSIEPKIAAQAAKLGKPFAEAGKNSKSLAGLSELAARVTSITDSGERDDTPIPGKPSAKSEAKGGGSLLGKLKLGMKKK